MIICPMQNTAIFDVRWMQKRPHITQVFGANPHIYKQFGLDGHNGLDLRAPIGTQLFAPFEGEVRVGNQGAKGYGRHIRIYKDNLEFIVAHLSAVDVASGDSVHLGDKIGLTGNSGFSTGPHLHLGLRFLNESGRVVNAKNGYAGYVDPVPYMLNWKGRLDSNSI